MSNYLKCLFLCIIPAFTGATYGQLRIIDFTQSDPYKNVFVETDNFDFTYLQSLESALDTLAIDTLYFSILNDLAYYWHTRNLNTALDLTNRGLYLASVKKDSLWHGRFQITEGSILLRQEKLDHAEEVLTIAQSKVLESDLPFLYTQLGYVYERRGELDKAADYALKSLRLGEELNDIKAQALAYSDLSNLFWKQSKFDKGLEFGLRSLELFEERNIDDLDYDFTLYVVGNNYLELKNYDQAIKYYERAKDIGERYGFYNNLSDVYISLTDLYTYNGAYDKANDAGINAVKFAELLDNNFMIMRSWLSIGKMQNQANRYTDAVQSLQKSINIATENFGDEYYLSQAYDALSKAYAGMNNFESAYRAQNRYHELTEAIFTDEADQRISLLQTEYDVAIKEDTIQLQESRIEQQRLRQILILVMTGLLLMLLIVVSWFFYHNRKRNLLLNKQNEEKAFLLKEIHHRVKNNLEVVSSLLELQSAQLSDQSAKEAMTESQNRVYSMSMIHQRLYKGENLSAIEMKEYFYHLGDHILDSFGAHDRIKMEYNIPELALDVDTAVPLGLIVNELLTNALKYAFPNNRQGVIDIHLEVLNENTFKLKVVDNGIGSHNVLKKGTGFGTQLIKLLVQQLNGKLIIDPMNVDGTSVAFEFERERAA